MSKQAGPIEQEAKKGHKLMALGHDTYAEVSTFKGKTYGSIRRWFQADDGNWYRTKNGINMVLNELLDIINDPSDVIDFLTTEGEHPYDNESNDKGW